MSQAVLKWFRPEVSRWLRRNGLSPTVSNIRKAILAKERRKKGRKNLRSRDLYDEGIPAENPGKYCLYCGIPLETDREKREGFCGDHLNYGGKNGENTGLK